MHNETNRIPLLMDTFLNTCWAILPAKLSEIMAVLQSKNNGLLLEMAEQGKQSKAQDSNYTVDDGIAMITINGTLSKRMGLIQALSGGTSYSNIQSQIKRAEDDPAVKGIFLDIDSPGGAVSEMFNTADAIFGLRGTKPSLAFANGLMASAAYIIGSGADCVVASDRSAETGSLGVISILFDESKKYEAAGIRPHVFAAGQYKKIGNKFEPLSKPDKKYIQSKLDYMFTLATDTV
jgi:signal peptide peptidase SppA